MIRIGKIDEYNPKQTKAWVDAYEQWNYNKRRTERRLLASLGEYIIIKETMDTQ